jgi:hypothetical protein
VNIISKWTLTLFVKPVSKAASAIGPSINPSRPCGG